MNKSWRDCSIDTFPSDASTPETSFNSAELSLLEWAVRSGWFQSPIIRKVDFFGHIFSRVAVGLKDPHVERSDVFGCGRDESLSSALSKAYVETIERAVALEALNEFDFVAKHRFLWTGKTYHVSRATQPALMPPKHLRTTNGWAVHFDLSRAIKNAFFEAVERHLLLLTYLKSGWSGFQCAPSINWEGLEMFSLASPLEFCGLRAGMVATKVSNHPGFTFGYFSDTAEKFPQSPRWLHAMMESFEPAKYYENESTRQIQEKLAAVTNPMDRTQLRYILEPALSQSLSQSNVSGVQVGPPDLVSPLANIVAVDISRKWSLDFPLFGAYIFGETLIPLFFKETLDNDDENYLANILAKYDVRELPDVHPIL
jgi:hypothetical protein